MRNSVRDDGAGATGTLRRAGSRGPGRLGRPGPLRRTAGLAALSAAAVVAVAACGSGTPAASDSPSANATAGLGRVASVYNLLPEKVKQAGEVNVAWQFDAGEPYGVVGTGNTAEGLDPDLANAIGAVMGVKVKLSGADFADEVTGVEAQRYDFSTNFTADTTAIRGQVGIIDFAFGEGARLVVKKDSANISLAQACGLTIAVNVGSQQQILAAAQSKKCVQEGKKSIDLLAIESLPDEILAVQSGRADAALVGTGLSLYVQNHDSATLKATTFNSNYQGLLGIILPKSSDIEPALRAAIGVLNSDGVLRKLMAGYGLGSLVPSVADVAKILTITDCIPSTGGSCIPPKGMFPFPVGAY